LIESALASIQAEPVSSLTQLIDIDNEARDFAQSAISKSSFAKNMHKQALSA